MWRRTLVSALMLLVVSSAVGCSIILPKKLDMGGLETQIANKVNTDLKTTGITVSCPDDVKPEAGGRFDCTATVSAGETFTILVTQTDGDGHVIFEYSGASTPSPSP